MGFMNGSKLYLKNPLEVFKRVNTPEDRENLVDIFYVGFHKRAFSKIFSQRTLNRYGTTGKDLAQIKKVIKGGNKGLLFPAERNDDGNSSGQGKPIWFWSEGYCTQGPGESFLPGASCVPMPNSISAPAPTLLGYQLRRALLCSRSDSSWLITSDPLTCCKKPNVFSFCLVTLHFFPQEM